jgi:hypothetical protein
VCLKEGVYVRRLNSNGPADLHGIEQPSVDISTDGSLVQPHHPSGLLNGQ